jgi:hypothetical protein
MGKSFSRPVISTAQVEANIKRDENDIDASEKKLSNDTTTLFNATDAFFDDIEKEVILNIDFQKDFEIFQSSSLVIFNTYLDTSVKSINNFMEVMGLLPQVILHFNTQIINTLKYIRILTYCNNRKTNINTLADNYVKTFTKVA